jgi:hypothetical protein
LGVNSSLKLSADESIIQEEGSLAILSIHNPTPMWVFDRIEITLVY